MNTHRSLRLSAVRRNTLAVCLAAALAAGGAGAARPQHSADMLRTSGGSAQAIFGAANGAWTRPQDSGMWPALDLPTHPAGTITVTSCEDDGPGSLREAFALAQAQGGDVIDLSVLTCPGSTITLTTGAIATAQHLILLGPGQDVLTVDGSYNDRVFLSTSGLAIYDLTIAHGVDNGGVGGCVYTNGHLQLTRATVTGCRAGDGSNYYSYGGGVAASGGLLMQESTISNNVGLAAEEGKGGGVWAGSDTTIERSTIAGNSIVSAFAAGGGVFAANNLTITASQVNDNAIESYANTATGGGIASGDGASIVNTMISGNTAYSHASYAVGGGIRSNTIELVGSTVDANQVGSGCNTCFVIGGGAFSAGEVTVSSTTVSGNQALSAPGSAAKAVGGGIAAMWFDPSGSAQIGLVNSTVSGNRAIAGTNGAGYGGGIATVYLGLFVTSGGQFNAFNSTIAFNEASDFGGGAVGGNITGISPLLSSTIVSNNIAPAGADIAPVNPSDSFTITGSDNLVMAVSAGVTFADEPLHDDPLLLPLADNGGTTKTHALDRLSPAINAGNNVGGFVFDQRGCPYTRVVYAVADIGAFEMADVIFGDGFDGEPLCP